MGEFLPVIGHKLAEWREKTHGEEWALELAERKENAHSLPVPRPMGNDCA